MSHPSGAPFINPTRLLVWVHTWWGRDELRNPTLASLDASDAASRYEVYRQPEGTASKLRSDGSQRRKEAIAFYMQTLHAIATRPDIDWMLRLEDDTLVNESLIHNLCQWKAVRHRRFGAGWLSVTNALLGDPVNCTTIGQFRVRVHPECHFAGGVFMRTALLKQALPRIERRLAAKGTFAPGCSIANAVWHSGKRVFFHVPALVFIDMSIETHHGFTSRRWKQPFRPQWKRG